VKGTNQAPKSGYDSTKRGYPDISALANKYQVVANGVVYVGKKEFVKVHKVPCCCHSCINT